MVKWFYFIVAAPKIFFYDEKVISMSDVQNASDTLNTSTSLLVVELIHSHNHMARNETHVYNSQLRIYIYIM